jgi:hypothetical protein
MQCLRKKPDERPSSARELRGQLRRCKVPSWTSIEATEWWFAFRARAADRQAMGEADQPLTIDVDAASRLTRTAIPSA